MVKLSILNRPWTGSIKTLGLHKSSVTCMLLLGNEESLKQPFATHLNGGSKVQNYVVMSGDKKGEVKIWYDGGSAITCTQSHYSSVRELAVLKPHVSIRCNLINSNYCHNLILFKILFNLPKNYSIKCRMEKRLSFRGAWLVQYEYGTWQTAIV